LLGKTPNKMSSRKNKYIKRALQIFKHEGLRLSLDELAEKMSVSKKTLYNHFDSKEQLHSDCMQSMFSNLNQMMSTFVDDSLNAIECMRKGFGELKTLFFELSPIFINDFRKLYPDMIYSSHASDIDLFNKNIMANLEKGMREGVYNPNLDVILISQYFSHSIFGFFFHSVITNKEFSSTNYFENILEYNLKGLVSEKGRQLL